jgi:hypothetical protein
VLVEEMVLSITAVAVVAVLVVCSMFQELR